MDAKSPAWKKFVFWMIYIPLFRFFHKRLRFITPDRVEADGSYSWLEHQGCFVTREDADADAKRYPFGFVVGNLPLGNSLPADTVAESATYFPNKEETDKASMVPLIHEAIEEIKRVRADARAARNIQ